MPFNGSNEERIQVIDSCLSIYRHHWDAYLKGIALYFAAVSIGVGLLFSDRCVEEADVVTSAIILFGSVIATIGNYGAVRWLESFDRDIANLFQPLGGAPIDFSMSHQIPKLFFSISLAISICGISGMLWSYKNLGDLCKADSWSPFW